MTVKLGAGRSLGGGILCLSRALELSCGLTMGGGAVQWGQVQAGQMHRVIKAGEPLPPEVL